MPARPVVDKRLDKDAGSAATHSERLESAAQLSTNLVASLVSVTPTIMSGTAFGRNIETAVRELEMDPQAVVQLQIRRRDAAAVLPWQSYENMVDTIRALQTEITYLKAQISADPVVQAMDDQFDALLERMRTPEAIAAAAKMSEVTVDELRESYHPGRTERAK